MNDEFEFIRPWLAETKGNESEIDRLMRLHPTRCKDYGAKQPPAEELQDEYQISGN